MRITVVSPLGHDSVSIWSQLCLRLVLNYGLVEGVPAWPTFLATAYRMTLCRALRRPPIDYS